MTRIPRSLPVLAAFALAACGADRLTDPTAESSETGSPSFEIVDGLLGGGASHFIWWTPIVPDIPVPTGPFDPTQSPTVQICELVGGACGASVVTFNTTTRINGGLVIMDAPRELYRVLFKTHRFTLDVDTHYRVIVRVDGTELGHADIDLINDSGEAGGIDRSEFVPVVNGTVFNIRFRIQDPDAQQAPTAEDDGYTMEQNGTLTIPNGVPDLLANDGLGTPTATLVSFGGGDLGGDETSHAAGTLVDPLPQGSGSLTVNADGGLTFSPPADFVGPYTFLYRLENAAGMSSATVTVTVTDPPPPPPPEDGVLRWWHPVVLERETVTGPFDPTLMPELEICALAGSDCVSTIVQYVFNEKVADAVLRVDLTREIYKVWFKTGLFALDVAQHYRIIVRVNGHVLRTRDIDLVVDQAEADLVDWDLFMPVINGDAVPIRFRIEQGTAPTAADDTYLTQTDTPVSRSPADADDLLDNDDPGHPASPLLSFGGLDLGGDQTTHAAGTTVNPLPQGSGSLTVSADGAFQFTPPAGFTGVYEFQYLLENFQGGSVATVAITVETPTGAVDDGYTASGNIAIAVDAANGVLVNDGGATTVTRVQGVAANVGNPTATDAVGRGGVTGTVTLNADGSFTYDPAPGFEGADTFTYGNDAGAAVTATVTITVSDMVWFIDNSAAGSDNTGTFNDPFLSLGDFNTANGATGAMPDPEPNDFIALRTGNGTYTEADGLNLRTRQLLIGEGVAFGSAYTADANSSAAYQAFAGASDTGPRIEVTGAGNHGIDLAADNTVRGLTIGDTDVTPNVGSFGMAGNAVGNLVVNSVSITGLGGALDVRGGSFGNNVVFDELSANSPGKEGLRVRNSDGTLVVADPASAIVGSPGGQAVRIGGGSLTMDYPGTVTQHVDRHIVEISNTNGGTITFSGTVAQAAAGGNGVKLSGVDGNVTFADLDLGTDATRNGGESAGVLIESIVNPDGSVNDSEGTFTFDDVSIFVTGAGNAGVRVANTVASGALVISEGTIDGDGVPAIDVELIALTLTSVDVISTSSGSEGIRLHDVTGAASFSGTTDIDNSTSAGIAIQSSAGSLALDLRTVDVAGAGTDGVRIVAAGTGSVCLNLAGSTSAGTGNGYALNNGPTSTFELQDFGGDGGLAADVAAWVTTTKANTGTVGVTVGSPFSAAAGPC